jgi:hypothetical protein
VFKNRVLRRIFGPKKEQVNKELRDLYSSLKYNYSNEIEGDEMGGASSTNAGGEKCI